MSSNEKKLLSASRDGDVETVRALLAEQNVDVNACYRGYGFTPLFEASSNGHFDIVELLLKANADPHAADEWGQTPLFVASSQQVVDALLRAKADLHPVDKDGNTPLHIACKLNKSDVARALLNSGADLHVTAKNGCEPLHCCIMDCWRGPGYGTELLETLQVLVSVGADWDAMCGELVDNGLAIKQAPALRICMSLWAQERTDGLDFTDIPLEVVRRGAESTKTFIETWKTSHEIVFRRKICLVGPSCAGKTSLVKSITSQKPQLEHHDDRSIGIDHFRHGFDQVIASREKPITHEMTFWDFAGQDAYQVAHSLFFSPRTLYLVCVDLEAFATAYKQFVIISDVDIQETKLLNEFVEYSVMRWIRMIVACQPDAEFVFVATKEDVLTDGQVPINPFPAQFFKNLVKAKLADVERKVHEMKRMITAEGRTATDTLASSIAQPRTAVNHEQPHIVFVSCTLSDSVQAARTEIEKIVIQSKRSFQMPYAYSRALKRILQIRKAANAHGIANQIAHVFAPKDSLPVTLQIEPDLCRSILQILHDLGDVLWYEHLGLDFFQNTVILDPLLLINFIRQVIDHNHKGVIMSHRSLKSKPLWMGLNNHQMKAMKLMLQKFRLVYPDDARGIMQWDSDLIVPACWQTKMSASRLFGGDILRITAARSLQGESVRLHWEFHFEIELPSSLFDHVVVASVAPYCTFAAGPDWIVYEEKGVAACRLMVSRDAESLDRTIRVEAVVSEAATPAQVSALWKHFRQLCGAFVDELRAFPGLVGVSIFAYDDTHAEHNLKRLMQSPFDNSAAKWMPPASTWVSFNDRLALLIADRRET